MYSTLHPKNNRILIACWAAVVAVLLLVTSGSAAFPCMFGATFGAWAGLLQRKALRRDAELFRAADTAWDVRRAMVASPEGKRAITLGWMSAAMLLVIAADSNSLLFVVAKVFAGYFSFVLLRDVVAYPALAEVAGGGGAGGN
jgi:hypothetical protein